MTEPRARAVAACGALVAALFAAGCGGGGNDGSQPVVKTRADWVKAADAICRTYLDDTDNAGIQGTRATGIAKEFAYLNAEMAKRRDGLAALPRPAAIKPAAARLVAFYGRSLALYRGVARAARRARPADARDPAVLRALSALDVDTSAEGTRIARALGTRVCGKPPPDAPPRPSEARFEGAAGLPRPNGPGLRATVESYLQSATGDQCRRFVGFAHSDDRRLTTGQCKAAARFLAGGRLAATREFGPVGVYDYLTAAGSYNAGYFVYDADQGGELRKAGDVNLTLSSLRRPPPGSDAAKTFEAVVEAIRDDDPGALRKTAGGDVPPGDALTPPQRFDRIGTSPSGGLLVRSLRADGETEPRMLAVTQGYAFATVAPERRPFLLVAAQGPGNPGHFGFVGFYPLFPTRGVSA